MGWHVGELSAHGDMSVLGFSVDTCCIVSSVLLKSDDCFE
jgi:hypothetical protein